MLHQIVGIQYHFQIFIERIIENKKNNSEQEKNELSLITISNNSINTFSHEYKIQLC